MKRIINILFFASIFACFFSCESDLDKTPMEVKSPPSGLSVTIADHYICTAENAADSAMLITWEKADFGENISCGYIVEFDLKGGDFSGSIGIVTENNATQKYILSDELNTIMHRLGRPIDTPTELDVRVLARPAILGSTYAPNLPTIATENNVTITVSSFAMSPMHLIGAPYSYTAPYAWSTSNFRFVMFRDDPLSLDIFITKFYEGYGQFKFLANSSLGSYDVSYGKLSPGILNPNGGGNIDDITETGYYIVEADFTKLIYTITPYDDSGAPVYTEISAKGTATASPVEFTRLFDRDAEGNRTVELDPHLWYVMEIDLTPGTLYFESNTGQKWGGETFPWGKYKEGIESIEIPKAGKYFIRFCDLTGHYVFYLVP